ncbi:13064_t:CDS:1 [Gigaspora margarita]|uniref:13064_t:CDS:1 n=1 Tax=Gigaspora margarita TaxID=4874 RepID=A0ABN7UC09_GIGMA|nr:13064_t:CDS:1 [Gigaspora margarita]
MAFENNPTAAENESENNEGNLAFENIEDDEINEENFNNDENDETNEENSNNDENDENNEDNDENDENNIAVEVTTVVETEGAADESGAFIAMDTLSGYRFPNGDSIFNQNIGEIDTLSGYEFPDFNIISNQYIGEIISHLPLE